jgi:hypothetical protein
MNEIKSARDIAQQKIDSVGEVSQADRLRWKYLPQGEKLGVKYLKEGGSLSAELAKFPPEAQPYVKKGVEYVLSSNIVLPASDAAREKNKKAADGMMAIKKDKSAAAKYLNQLRQVLDHYSEQGARQREATKKALKDQYQSRVKQAMDRQLGGGTEMEGMKINVENMPQFQDEWRRTAAQLDEQYLKLMEEFKKELSGID